MKVGLSDSAGAWAVQAADYLQRGDQLMYTVADPAAADVVVSDGPGVGDWRFTDLGGEPLGRSRWIRAAVAGDADTVDVQLRDRSRILARGRVDVRRTVAATIGQALAAAGPLIEMAVAGAAPGGDLVDIDIDDPPGDITTSLRSHVMFAKRLARAAVTYRQWGVARLDPNAVSSMLTGPATVLDLRWQSPPPDHFWADPAVVGDARGHWLFVEELDRKLGIGHIRALPCRGPQLGPGTVVHTSRHHVSFPQVQWIAGRWIATVETCATDNPMMTFDRLGEPWRVASDLPTLPPHLADPVVQFDQAGRPVRVIGTDAQTSPDAVFTEYRFEDDSWARVPGSTYVDVRSARGGGTWDHVQGIRAVQDCARTYGAGLRLVPDQGWFGAPDGSDVVHLDGTSAHGDGWNPEGVHTLTWTPEQDQVWIDGWHRRASALGGYRRMVERRHLATCQG